ncbi:unnamed protein product [Hymenolepis diminuta]|uniref:AGC-kinase C-terminal domain-containing protein n=1 Tax=Hymenolepis diminuta TaxID=6216 RepID=A0A0R3SI96_HYMDI|nr:unnamed protein product [Hymenolepis diminuta]VUZ40647.1 unnamed protein product [Hymenolepis diminuta]
MVFLFSDLRNDYDTDSGFGDVSTSDLVDGYVDWVPPVNRKRHPAGDGTFCSPPSMPIPQRDPTLLPSPAFSFQSEFQLSVPSTSGFPPFSVDSINDWIPPANRKRHPAGSGEFCCPSSVLIPKWDPTLRPTAFSFQPGTQSEFQSSSLPNQTTSRSHDQGFSLPQSSSDFEPVGAYILRRFLDDSRDNRDSNSSSDAH